MNEPCKSWRGVLLLQLPPPLTLAGVGAGLRKGVAQGQGVHLPPRPASFFLPSTRPSPRPLSPLKVALWLSWEG